MIIWGISALSHDASISVINEKGDILFAGHSERYSKTKNDPYLNFDIINDAYYYGKPDIISFFENRWLKKTRQFLDFQFKYFFDFSKFPNFYLKKFNLKNNFSFYHHESHAASGYYTSNFNDAAIVVIDSIGEWNTISIWKAKDNKINILKKVNYPSSLGLIYSCFTKRCGFKPNEEEYIMMGLSSYGEPIYKEKIYEDFIDKNHFFKLKKRCEHGIGNYLSNAKIEDLAASIQSVLEECITKIIYEAKKLTNSENLVYSGGVALNCVANSKINTIFKNTWIMPNCGDAGTSLGAAALVLKKKLTWKNVFLGYNIKKNYELEKISNELCKNNVVGIANNRAEFGPRALGNRSLLADPRNKNTKNNMNLIKKREKFRPFAASILEEDAKNYFQMNVDKSPYMQFTFKCKFPNEFPAICHVDGTSRIQTVSKNDNLNFYYLLKEYKEKSGCPMLLNTSLNIKGKPIVNNEKDVLDFIEMYGIAVY